ncbi:flagellar hook-length control protein FliK [Marinobacterium jannaschii]|uniref:flagellar hook-length control protein FliK n=1 Tax=Marinobacterium jannaschii TaxID=64970 RepID=UPI001470DC4E|nr:flagellar hook-length control protein FliK [Marinobacterium jannaschii]
MSTMPPVREPAPPQTVAGTAASRPSPESQSNSRGVLPQPGPSTPVGGKEGTPAATASTADSKSLPTAAPLTSVVSQPPPAVRNTTFQLQLALNNGSNIQLQSDKPLPQGSQLQFNLQPDGSVVSKVLQASSATTMSALDQLEIQSSLRQALPQQISLGNALTQLNHFATEPQNSPVSSVVRSMLQLFGFKPAQRSPSIIQQNIELGGHQTENQLAKTHQTNSQDMKSQLSILQQLSKQLPEAEANRLDQLVQGIKARITGQQIQALQQRKEQPDGQFERVLQLDIPVHFQNKLENVELKISHEAQAHHGEELKPQWRVRLHFDLQEDGSVDAEIRLRENDQLSTQFWCNKQSTYLKLQQRLDEFNQRLLQQGYTEAELQCHHGSAPEKQAPVQKQLIDLRT